MQQRPAPSFWLNPTFLMLFIPLIIMLALMFFTPEWDIAIEKYFYRKGGGHFIRNDWTYFFFNWAVVPAEATAVIAAIIYFGSFIFPAWERRRKPALVLILSMVFGAGVLVHLVLKDHWGRPRPVQTEMFGGDAHYRPFYEPDIILRPNPYRSFPCGHCTMGFYFFTLALVGRRERSGLLFYGGIVLAIVLGIGLSVTRMAQGGHFFSDTLMAAIIMWWSAVISDWFVYSYLDTHERNHKEAA